MMNRDDDDAERVGGGRASVLRLGALRYQRPVRLPPMSYSLTYIRHTLVRIYTPSILPGLENFFKAKTGSFGGFIGLCFLLDRFLSVQCNA